MYSYPQSDLINFISRRALLTDGTTLMLGRPRYERLAPRCLVLPDLFGAFGAGQHVLSALKRRLEMGDIAVDLGTSVGYVLTSNL